MNTDEGISGFGEAGISTGIGERAIFGMLQDMAPLLIGRNPMDNEVFWEELREKSRVIVAIGDNVVAEADIDRVEKISDMVDKFRY